MRLAPDTDTDEGGGAEQWLEDATCLACGCLCDDIRLNVSNGRIVDAERACPRGRDWFLTARPSDRVEAAIEGRAAYREEAVAQAVAWLEASKAPVVTGLVDTSCEDQIEAVRLAERLGAVIDPEGSERLEPVIAAFQRVGSVWASLGEIKQRADVIMFWDLDSETELPRFWERWVEPAGRFVPQGRSGRHVLALSAGGTADSERADECLRVSEDRQSQALGALRALVRGVPLDAGRTARATGQPLDAWKSWAERLRQARYSAIVFGGRLAARGTGAVEPLLRLVVDLNATSRSVAFWDAGPGNSAGALATLTGRLGAPICLDLGTLPFRHFMVETSVPRRLARAEADALVVVGQSSAVESGSKGADRPPTVWVGPDATRPIEDARRLVAIATGFPSIDAGGTVERTDGARLRLRPPLGNGRPTAATILQEIYKTMN